MKRDTAYVVFNPATAAWAVTSQNKHDNVKPHWTKNFHEASFYDTLKFAEWAAFIIGGADAIVQIQTVQATWVITNRQPYTAKSAT